MNSKFSFLKISLVAGIFMICPVIKGQKLIESRQTSYMTYIYQLTDKEAKEIYKKGIWKVDPSFFHTLIDSFPTDGQYTGKLSPGHYLKTFSERNKQRFFITSVPDFDVKIFNNNTDLCIQVYDLTGKIISDANVKVRLKHLRFDKKSEMYLDKKSNQKGLLSVNYDGYTAYYQLSRKYNNSLVKRGTRTVLYGTPLKYIWLPVNYIICLPIDGAKSIIKGWPQGTIYRTKNFFSKSFSRIAGIFDDYYYDSYSDSRFQQKQTGYMVFNKPKYHQGDTVKFKAFLLSKRGIPVSRKVKVILSGNKKPIELARLNPYLKGGYEYSFFIHDSLKLQLDRSYDVSLQLKPRKEFINESFRYEDYELSKNKLEIRIDTIEQYRGKPFKVYVKGTDENNLNLLDARLEILVRPKEVNEFFSNHVFVPDTLLCFRKTLLSTEETPISIPDSLFPGANFKYSLQVRLITSDNESITETKEVNYYHLKKEFKLDLKADSVYFFYKESGNLKPKNVIISATDNFGYETPLMNTVTPCRLLLNPYYKNYRIESDSLKQTFDISDQSSLLQCLSERTKDSVSIVVENPRKLTFAYNIYRKNTELIRGYSDALALTRKASNNQNYIVSIRYLWGGKVKEENYTIPYNDKTLNLTVIQPKIVYPGQKSKIEILVTDKAGKPVKGVDLTAYSLTKKFNYSAPELPYLGKVRKNKTIINNFSFKDTNPESTPGLKLDYNAWKLMAGLDSIEYYKFIYPGNDVYRFEYFTIDSLTQFAPFVLSNGHIIPVHVIYVDNKPVYFSWSTNIQPYSFRIDTGFHQIKLRTSVQTITLDSVYFKQGKKLVFSLNDNLVRKNIRFEKVDPLLSISEKRSLYRYIFPYRNTFGEMYGYIRNGNTFQFLKPSVNNYYSENFAGPVAGNVTFNLVDGFSSNFNHEPFFEYEFAPGLLKMRTIDEKTRYPKLLSNYNINQSFSDRILTEEKLKDQWKDYVDNKRFSTAHYKYPVSTSPGAGKLLILNPESDKNKRTKDIPLNLLVFRYDNSLFLRVYPGNTTLIHQLDKGLHKLIFFYSGARYVVVDSVNILPNGLNYYQIKEPQTFQKDTFSIYVSHLIEETIFSSDPYSGTEEKELKQIYNVYQQQFRYTGEGNIVDGYVYENGTMDPLPGVNVVAKGTSYGTMTDVNGHYSLKIPHYCDVLVYAFIGYKSQEINIGNRTNMDVMLIPDVQSLQEVVVTGYGLQRKSSLTGSVATVSANNLTIPGVSSNIAHSLEGRVSGIQIISDSIESGGVSVRIRGVNTVNFKNKPLYIINGSVFTGDITDLDPTSIDNIEVLKDANATAIYGSMASNGVLIINTKGGSFKSTGKKNIKGADYDNSFLEAASQSSSIRDNFSDYAFWKPKLITDKKGKAGFDVTFPDDVTSWKTYYLAMNDHKQSGQSENIIKSYKPLMAQLAVPRFLVQSDTSYAIGKIMNYMPDSINVTSNFEINNLKVFSKKHICNNSVIDTLPIVAKEDSINLKYYLKKSDGYFDGELKKIPVFPAGLEETKGNFSVLQRDTTLELSFDPALGKVNLYACVGYINVIDAEIVHMMSYRYFCNEQIASKLKALLALQIIDKYRDVKFKDDREIEKLIRLLLKNQESNNLWGWWKNSDLSYWISLHVLEALTQAKQMGYSVDLNETRIKEDLIWALENNKDLSSGIRILRILRLFNVPVSYNAYIENLEKNKKITLSSKLQLLELKQLCSLPYKTDSILPYKRETLFGSIYFSDRKNTASTLFDNDIQNTILAYRILRNDTLTNSSLLVKIRNYFLEARGSGYWNNTFESAQIIETILPDLIGNKMNPEKATLTISGDITKTITEFPFEYDRGQLQKIKVTKVGDFPVYFSAYQHFWNPKPVLNGSDFIITTDFDNDKSVHLEAGKVTKLITNLEVKKDADYVMINIPIPGGCSYADKENNYRYEIHREYFKNETVIFCEKLKAGSYTFEIDLMPRYSGIYTLNPAKVELMYFPTFNANTELKKVYIK